MSFPLKYILDACPLLVIHVRMTWHSDGCLSGEERAGRQARQRRRDIMGSGGTLGTVSPLPTGPGPPTRAETRLLELAAVRLQAMLAGHDASAALTQGRPQSLEARLQSLEARPQSGGDIKLGSLETRLSACASVAWVFAGTCAGPGSQDPTWGTQGTVASAPPPSSPPFPSIVHCVCKGLKGVAVLERKERGVKEKGAPHLRIC